MVGAAFMVGVGLYGRGRPLKSGVAFRLEGGIKVRISHVPRLTRG